MGADSHSIFHIYWSTSNSHVGNTCWQFCLITNELVCFIIIILCSMILC